LLVVFVKQVEQLYGSEYLVYNVHSLIHLADDVRLFGNLNHISAFPFENYLRKLKRLVKQPREPLQQIVRRVIEKKILKIELQTLRELKLTCLHDNGPVPVDVINVADVEQYAVAHMANYVVSLKVKDNCLLTTGGDVCLVKNILHINLNIFFVCQVFDKKIKKFELPLPFSLLQIFEVSSLNPRLQTVSLSDIVCKGVCLPLEDSTFFVVPLLHDRNI